MTDTRFQRLLHATGFVALTVLLVLLSWSGAALSSSGVAAVYAPQREPVFSDEGIPDPSTIPVVTGLSALYMLVSFTLFLRRRYPWLVLAVGLFGTFVLQFDPLIACMVMASVVARRQGKGVVVVAVLAGVATAFHAIRDAFLLPAHLSPSATVLWDDESILAGEVSPGREVVALAIPVFVYAIALVYGLLMRSRRQAAEARRETRQEQRRSSALQQQTQRLTERERLARDVHDTLAHRLSLISMHSHGLENAAASTDPRLATAAKVLRDNAKESLNDLRGLVESLRTPQHGEGTLVGPPGVSTPPTGTPVRSAPAGAPVGQRGRGPFSGTKQPQGSTVPSLAADAGMVIPPIPPAPPGLRPGTHAPPVLQPATRTPRPRPVGLHDLDALLRSSRQAGLDIRPLIALPPPEQIDARVSEAAFRIVQECLTNVHKHAPGSPVWLRLGRTQNGELRIHVANQLGSAGPLAGSGSGTGLLGIRERTAELGGRCSLGPDGHGGFVVEVHLPPRAFHRDPAVARES